MTAEILIHMECSCRSLHLSWCVTETYAIRWRVESSLIGSAGGDGRLHGVVDFDDGPHGAVLAVRFFVLAADDGEGVHDVGHGVSRGGEAAAWSSAKSSDVSLHGDNHRKRRAERQPPVRVGWQVQVEEGGVQLAAQQEAAVVVPGGTADQSQPQSRREGLEVLPSRRGQLEGPRQQPVSNETRPVTHGTDRLSMLPAAGRESASAMKKFRWIPPEF